MDRGPHQTRGRPRKAGTPGPGREGARSETARFCLGPVRPEPQLYRFPELHLVLPHDQPLSLEVILADEMSNGLPTLGGSCPGFAATLSITPSYVLCT